MFSCVGILLEDSTLLTMGIKALLCYHDDIFRVSVAEMLT